MTISDDKNLQIAAAIVQKGGLVAMPTETVYGLAADATNDKAVARVFEAKGRPQFNPLIVHVADLAMAQRYVDFSALAEKLGHAFWPGALTLVLPRNKTSEISLLASAGLNTLGVRAPNHPIAQALIKSADRPLAAPSANRSGTISPTQAGHVKDSLGDKIDMILDGGASPVGVESTIVKIDDDQAFLLRPGGIPVEEIEQVLGAKVNRIDGDKVEAPGMLTSHYAPAARLRLNATTPEPGEAFLGFGAVQGDGPYALNLSPTGDLIQAAANLFSFMRKLDAICTECGLSRIAAAPIPTAGLGEAINDRLVRAAAPRP